MGGSGATGAAGAIIIGGRSINPGIIIMFTSAAAPEAKSSC